VDIFLCNSEEPMSTYLVYFAFTTNVTESVQYLMTTKMSS